MDYYEIKISFESPELWKDIFISFLAEAGCDSFSDDENDEALLCYISETAYSEENIKYILERQFPEAVLHYTIQFIKARNWNEVWESNYPPVVIADRCYIRAPFHEPKPNIEFEIVIEPKMSFGTAHHETTSLMINYLLEEDLQGKTVLDMGAGTGVLAILAHKRGATSITAIDNDEWAYKNNIENNQRNGTEDITVILGDAANLEGLNFDFVIANINRNILLRDMSAYVKAMNDEGTILFSGFYVGEDLKKISALGETLGLKYISHKEKNNWCAAKFIKSNK